MLLGSDDAFISDQTKRASFLSHIPDSESDTDTNCHISDIINLVSQCSKPVVAAVSGNVAGSAGLELAMSCDYRVALTSSMVASNQDPSATVLTQGTLYEGRRRRKKETPMNRLLNGDAISAIEAKEVGLFDEVIDVSESSLLETVAMQVARKNKKRMHPARELRFKKLLYYIPEQFLILRTSQLFNIIRDFPESQSLLEELRVALSITCQSEYVIASIKRQLGERLLIPGAHTEDVLEMYLRTYKVISILFPDRSMDVFVKIATPVIHHLQKRPDSVKCIVGTLLDQGEDAEVDSSFSKPPPAEEESTDDEVKGAKNDTMSLLIGVYGGQEYFLNEYKDMLAGRLVSIGSFEIDRELASLDLMKSKFGEAALAHCSVMIRDVTESRKLNAKIRSQLPASSQLTMLVKSSHFWPTNNGTGMDVPSDPSDATTTIESFSFLPPETVGLMSSFERSFTNLKPTQKIEWRKTEGLVTIGVQLTPGGREVEFRLSPVYVEVLSLFEKISLPTSSVVASSVHSPHRILSLEAVAEAVKLPPQSVRPVVQFWVSKGILREVEINKFSINE